MHKLSHIIADKVIHEYSLKEGIVGIGRSPDNDICLNDKVVSGHHLQIFISYNSSLSGNEFYESKDMEVMVQDMGSTNGTFINGRRITQCTLKPGDVIRLSNHEFLYSEE